MCFQPPVAQVPLVPAPVGCNSTCQPPPSGWTRGCKNKPFAKYYVSITCAIFFLAKQSESRLFTSRLISVPPLLDIHNHMWCFMHGKTSPQLNAIISKQSAYPQNSTLAIYKLTNEAVARSSTTKQPPRWWCVPTLNVDACRIDTQLIPDPHWIPLSVGIKLKLYFNWIRLQITFRIHRLQCVTVKLSWNILKSKDCIIIL